MNKTKSNSFFHSWVGKTLALIAALAALFLGTFLAADFFLPERVAQNLVAMGRTPVPVQGTPQDHGLRYENAVFKTQDGLTLKGWWIPARKGKALGTVVLIHGVFHNRVQMLSRAAFLNKAGYACLLFDLRGEGESDQASLTGGVNEAQDVVAAVEFIRSTKRLQKPLALFGLSLGGMAAIRAAASIPDAAIIADSPLPDIRAYVSHRTLARWFIYVPGFFRHCVESYDRLTGLHLTPEDLDLDRALPALKGRDVLYFIGQKDEYVPVKRIVRFFNDTRTHNKRLFITPSGQHDKTYEAAPALYEQTVLSFLKACREGFPARREE